MNNGNPWSKTACFKGAWHTLKLLPHHRIYNKGSLDKGTWNSDILFIRGLWYWKAKRQTWIVKNLVTASLPFWIKEYEVMTFASFESDNHGNGRILRHITYSWKMQILGLCNNLAKRFYWKKYLEFFLRRTKFLQFHFYHSHHLNHLLQLEL